jgi:hypothetical protein
MLAEARLTSFVKPFTDFCLAEDVADMSAGGVMSERGL